MSPLNRGPLLGPRVPPVGIRPPPLPRFGGRLPPPRMLPPPMGPVFGPMRQMLPPPPRPGVIRPNGVMPLFGPRSRGMAPMVPPMGMRANGPRGPMMRPWPRRALPPPIMSHMRPRFGMGNGNAKGKPMNNAKKANKLEELELKKPWMTDEIRSEIQKKNKLYVKAKKNKDAKEWEEFKDLRNKVTRMIRDAKNEYLAKNPEQAHLYPEDEEPYDQRDENCVSADEEESYYCEVCDRDFQSENALTEHKNEHKMCGIDGCTFSAHSLLVERHITMQHSTGLYHRMKNLSTPEDIEKWLLERKKKYPTKANIELRKAEELEKNQRGELIKQQNDVLRQTSKKTMHTRERKRTQKRAKHFSDKTPVANKEIYRGIFEFSGTLSLSDNDADEKEILEETCELVKSDESISYISDEEEPGLPKRENTIKPSPIVLPNVLNLVANYGSDSDDSGPEDVPIKKTRVDDKLENTVVNVEVSKTNTGQETTNRSTSVPKPQTPTQKPHSTIRQKDAPSNNKNAVTKVSNQRDNTFTNTGSNRRLELLHRLLSRSIQHERNQICQCIKYIVDNNYFD